MPPLELPAPAPARTAKQVAPPASLSDPPPATAPAPRLKAKLAADEELQALLKAAGLNPQFYVFEQLDSDGDAKITFKEFAKLLEYVKPPQEPLAPVARLGVALAQPRSPTARPSLRR